MNFFHRDPAPAPRSRASDWAETRIEPAAPDDGWAETRIDAAQAAAGWGATRIDASRVPDARPPTRADAAAAPDGWSETRAQTALATRFLGEPDDYLAANPQDIGRLTGADVRELFVSCDPAEALQQQFDHLQPEFIAIHDIGTASTRRLLAGIAGAHSRRVQRLVVRRQGFGTALATLEFVDVPTVQGKQLRLYSTDADADPDARIALARTLLGFSRLGVVMVGDVAADAMSAALQPLGDAMTGGAWRNRQLLLLPLAAAANIVSHGIALGQVSGVAVRTTPQVVRPADAWQFIAASWGRFGDPVAGTDARPVETPPPLQSAVPARATPEVGAAAAPPSVDPAIAICERYLRQLGDVAGMVSCCVFDSATGRVVAHAGASLDATQLALNGHQLLAAMGVASRSLGLGRMTPDAAITLGAHHLLVRGVPNHPALAMHAVLDKHIANLALVRLQLQRLDAAFELPAG